MSTRTKVNWSDGRALKWNKYITNILILQYSHSPTVCGFSRLNTEASFGDFFRLFHCFGICFCFKTNKKKNASKISFLSNSPTIIYIHVNFYLELPAVSSVYALNSCSFLGRDSEHFFPIDFFHATYDFREL